MWRGLQVKGHSTETSRTQRRDKCRRNVASGPGGSQITFLNSSTHKAIMRPKVSHVTIQSKWEHIMV